MSRLKLWLSSIDWRKVIGGTGMAVTITVLFHSYPVIKLGFQSGLLVAIATLAYMAFLLVAIMVFTHMFETKENSDE